MVRIANCSGFFGDRLSAAREMVEGGPIDVLTGDWLAELTMLVLARQRLKHGSGSGYARTFLTQMEQVLGTCLDRGITVVSNAGGLDPEGCAAALHELSERLGLHPRIAFVDGDDLMPRLDELAAAGERLVNLDTGEEFASVGLPALTANAYLGGFGIKAALDAGADVVVTGRVTDAALVVGPAAHAFGWGADDLDALAGAVVAGHVIECGTQATGGNYAFFQRVPGLEHPGFPIAEVARDGSSTITKHPGSGGAVTVGTVTAQLLYEVGGPAYPNPDVTARFDSVELVDGGPDRVHIIGVRGEAPPVTAKVALNYLGGFRNTMTLVLTGPDIEAKAELAERTLWARTPREAYDEVDVQLVRGDRPDPRTAGEAQAHLRFTVKDRDPAKVGRAFSNLLVEIGLGTYPGYFPTTVPGEASPYGVYWPTSVPTTTITQRVVLDGLELARVPPTSSPVIMHSSPLAEPGPDAREGQSVHDHGRGSVETGPGGGGGSAGTG
ncbi:MAG TPA: acyclic terpene utilization AtuA family protein, partial [Candidatus Limnocylindria bacterium]|nr:acyclic terpene utilization AtuA family protein [Candidatus Limnocylindria bacterium]